MADVSVNSAALDKLSASLEGQTIALKALTESNQRAILQKDETVNIKGVQTRGGGTRPYDEVTANAIATGNQPLVDALKKDKEPGILSKLLKGILIGGAGYLIYQAITRAPELKAIFDKGVSAVKNFLVGENGILNKAYDFLFKDGQGEDAGIIRRMVRAISEVFPEGSLLDNIATSVEGALQSIGNFVEGIPFILPMIEDTFSDLRAKIEEFVSTSFAMLQDTAIYKKVMEVYKDIKDFITITVPLYFDEAKKTFDTLMEKKDKFVEGIKGAYDYVKEGFLQADIENFLAKMINNVIDKVPGLRKALEIYEKAQLTKANVEVEVDHAKAVYESRGEIAKEFARGIPGIGRLFKQQGGSVMAGMGYTIGEDGPETFIPGGNGTILPNIVKPIQKLGDDIVTELSSGSIVRGLDSLGDKMDNLAASMAGSPGVVTVPGAESPGTNYNGVYEQRSLVR